MEGAVVQLQDGYTVRVAELDRLLECLDATLVVVGEHGQAKGSQARIDWNAVSAGLMAVGQDWGPALCQGMWKMMAYADVGASVDALKAKAKAKDVGGNGWMPPLLLLPDSDDEDINGPPATSLRRTHVNKKARKCGNSTLGTACKGPGLNVSPPPDSMDISDAPRLLSGAISKKVPRNAGSGSSSDNDRSLRTEGTATSLSTFGYGVNSGSQAEGPAPV